MLTFRAIHDYKGIRKGEVWELFKCFDTNDVNEFTQSWIKKQFAMTRTIDNITKTIFLSRDELEENFEWISAATIERRRKELETELWIKQRQQATL